MLSSPLTTTLLLRLQKVDKRSTNVETIGEFAQFAVVCGELGETFQAGVLFLACDSAIVLKPIFSGSSSCPDK